MTSCLVMGKIIIANDVDSFQFVVIRVTVAEYLVLESST